MASGESRLAQQWYGLKNNQQNVYGPEDQGSTIIYLEDSPTASKQVHKNYHYSIHAYLVM